MKLTREQTQTIIDNGKAKGLSGQSVLDGLISRGYEPEGIDVGAAKQAIVKEQSPVVEQKKTEGSISSAFKAGIDKVKTGYNQSLNASNPLELIEGGLKQGAGLVETAFSPLAPVGEVISKPIGYVTDKISDIPAVQEFASSKAGEVTERVVGDIADANTIASVFVGGKSAKKAGSKALDISKKTIADLTPDDLAKYPKQIADKISDKLTTLDPQVKTALKTTTVEQFDDLVKKGQVALKDSAALKPKQLVGEKVLKQTLPAIKEDLSNIGSQKAKTLSSVSSTRVPEIGTSQIDSVKTILQKNLTKAERKFVNDYIKELQVLGKNPSVGSVDALVDKMQSTFFESGGKNAIPVTTRVKSLINKSIGEINSKLKSTVDSALGGKDYSLLNDAYSRKIKIFSELNKTIGIEGAKGGSLIERFTVGNDTGIKKLFAKVKQEYGIDLAKDATIAQFVEDSLGFDPASIYTKTVPLTKSGLATKAVNYAYNKVQNPIKKARKTIVESQAR